MKRPTLLLFDVNETLLDLSSMKAEINRALGHEYAFNQWFLMLLHYSLVENSKGTYRPFGEVGVATLRMAAKVLGCQVVESDYKRLVGLILARPPHQDVVSSLEKLKEAGYRLAALTNSAHDALIQQMKFAGLTHFFEALISVDEFRKYKPDPTTYLGAASHLQLQKEEIMMVAAHGWDVAGASEVGMQSAFLARPGQTIYPLAKSPDMVEANLWTLTQRLVLL